MNRIVLLMLAAALLSGCGPQKLSTEDSAREKKAVESVITSFWKLYESKDLGGITKLFSTSPDMMFFGTDSAEVIRNVTEWQSQMMYDWQVFETIKTGALRNLSVQFDDHALLASTIFEMPFDVRAGGGMSHFLGRVSFTMRKENGDWRIVHGLIALATNGQSSAELAGKMKAGKK